MAKKNEPIVEEEVIVDEETIEEGTAEECSVVEEVPTPAAEDRSGARYNTMF